MRNNENIYSSAEESIEKIATRSAASASPYVALCDGQLTIVLGIGLLNYLHPIEEATKSGDYLNPSVNRSGFDEISLKSMV